MSCNCNAKYDNKIPCCCSTGFPTECTTTVCPDAQPCNQTVETDCIIYHGNNYDCIDIENNMTITEVIDNILGSLNLIDCTTTIPVGTFCYLVNNTRTTLSANFTYKDVFNQSITTTLLANQRTYVCSMETIVADSGIIITPSSLPCINSVGPGDCVNPAAYCHSITVVGASNFQYINYQGVLSETGIITDTVYYLCAWEGSVSVIPNTGVSAFSIYKSDDFCLGNTDCPLCSCYEVGTLLGCKLAYTTCDGTEITGYDLENTTVCVKANLIGLDRSYPCTAEPGHPYFTRLGTSCEMDSDCWPTLNLQAFNIDRFNPRQVIIWGSPYTPDPTVIPWMIDYGDGTTAYFTGSQTFNTIDDHIYATPFTGTIKIKAVDLGLIKTLYCSIAGQSFTTGSVTLIGSEFTKLVNLQSITNINWNLNSTALQIPRNLDTLYSLRGQITGDIADLPSTLTKISLLGAEANLLSGNIIDLPTGLTILRIDGLNTITGNVSTFPGAFDSQMVRIVIQGRNTISGNLSEFSTYTTLVEFDLKGFNTLVGSICNFNSIMQRIVILGYSSPSGNISCLTGSTALTALSLENDETDIYLPPGTGTTVTGDIANLPNSLITVTVAGLNTLYGDIMDMPTSTTYWMLRGENTITGDIATIPSTCVNFTHAGFSTLYGNIATIHSNFTRFYISFKAGGGSNLSGIIGDIHLMPKANLTQFSLYGNHHVNTYSASSVWHPNMNACIVQPTADRGTYFISTPQLDQLVIDLAATTWTATTSFDNAITLCGTRSATSNAAYTTLSAIPAPNNILITIAP